MIYKLHELELHLKRQFTPKQTDCNNWLTFILLLLTFFCVKKKYILKNILIALFHTLKNAGLNTTQRWVKYGRTQRLGCFVLGYCPEGWVKHLTQMLVENNPIVGFVLI